MRIRFRQRKSCGDRMKKTQNKDAVRNILRQKVSYLSIVVIATLAVTAYLGIAFPADALIKRADRYFQNLQFRDAEVVSTLFVTKEDLDAIRAIPGVADVEGAFTTTGKIEFDSIRKEVSVLSLTERINVVDVQEGRMPEAVNECVLESILAQTIGVKVGDRIRIGGKTSDIPDYMTVNEFTVVGTGMYSELYCEEVSHTGLRDVFVLPGAFDHEALDHCYVKALIRYEKPENTSYYSGEYVKLSAEMTDRINELSEVRTALRGGDVQERFDREIADGEEKLAAAKEELDDAAKQIEEKTAELEDGERLIEEKEKELAEAEPLLKEGEEKLEDAKRQLDESAKAVADGKATLDKGRAELDQAAGQLMEGKQTLESTYSEIEAKKEEIRDRIRSAFQGVLGNLIATTIPWASPSAPNVDDPSVDASEFYITKRFSVKLNMTVEEILTNAVTRILTNTSYENRIPEVLDWIHEHASDYDTLTASYDSVVNDLKKWNEGHETYLDGRAQYLEGEAAWADGKARYESGLKQYQDGLRLYEDGLREYEEKKALYDDGVKALEEGKQAILDGKKAISEGKAQYEDGLRAYKEGEEKLQRAKEQRDSLNTCRWVVLDADGSVAYVHAKESAANVRKLAMTFSLLFVMVGALVIYATIARMVEEQRTLIGTTKALGFFTREILGKYMVFGVSATLIGTILGTLLGYFLVQQLVLKAYSTLYVDKSAVPSFLPIPTAIVIVAGVLLSAGAVLVACSNLTRSSAKELMQQPAPKARKGTGKNSRLSLYTRLMLRNVWTERKRVFVTVISIAGCCVLLMIGFTLRSGITGAISKQFGEIIRYEQEVVFDSGVSETAEADIEAVLREEGVDYAVVYSKYLLFSYGRESTTVSVVVGDPEKIAPFFEIRDISTGEIVTPGSEGALIYKRLHETFRIDPGDAMTIMDEKINPHTVKAAGVYDNYFGRYVFLTEEGYRNAFGELPKYNVIWIKGAEDTDALNERLSTVAGYNGMNDIVSLKASANQMASILTLITLILILCAGMMAYFILLNLTGMHLLQKKRELTIMRINGFTTKEVTRYVSREIQFTTAVGIVVGLGLGMLLGYLIIRFTEQGHAQFVRGVSWVSALLSAAITTLFSFVINAIALRKVKNLKLKDI